MERKVGNTDLPDREDTTPWIVLSILGVVVVLGILLAHTYRGDRGYELRGRYLDETKTTAPAAQEVPAPSRPDELQPNKRIYQPGPVP